MSGARRAVMKTVGSIFFASACAAPLARTAERFSSPRRKTGTEAWYIESVIGIFPEPIAAAPRLGVHAPPFHRALDGVFGSSVYGYRPDPRARRQVFGFRDELAHQV